MAVRRFRLQGRGLVSYARANVNEISLGTRLGLVPSKFKIKTRLGLDLSSKSGDEQACNAVVPINSLPPEKNS